LQFDGQTLLIPILAQADNGARCPEGSNDDTAWLDWLAVVHVPAAVDVVVEFGAAPTMRPSKKTVKTAFSRSASASVSLLYSVQHKDDGYEDLLLSMTRSSLALQ
jgi:hypothetical protein